MIKIKKSAKSDTRFCDCTKVTKEELRKASRQHIWDVTRGMMFLAQQLASAAHCHDEDKIRYIDKFHADFVTGFKTTEWWDNHRKISRHHLDKADGIPDDVNLLDVLEYITDCVMAGMARKGSVYKLKLPDEVLRKAFDNTVKLMKNQVVVEENP